MKNLLPACKNLGVTHITNGCYRLHPVEWNIGEAAGAFAAFALETSRTPGAILQDPTLLRTFQHRLLTEGVALYWLIDVPVAHPAFVAIQRLAMAGVWEDTDGTLDFRPDTPVSAGERTRWVERALGRGHVGPAEGSTLTRAELAMALERAGKPSKPLLAHQEI